MYDKSLFRKKKEIALILRGGPGVGKSTLAEVLAKKIPFSAKIDIDNLRYMIKGGLVASKSDLRPYDYQEEYFHQCRLGDKNAFALAKNFLEAGFIPIIAGLNGGESAETFNLLENPDDLKWYPKTEVIRNKLPHIKTFQIILDAVPKILTERLKIKGHDAEAIKFILNQRKIFLKAVSLGPIDYIIDTSNKNPDSTSDKIINDLNLQNYF
jgi:hypothetical protein